MDEPGGSISALLMLTDFRSRSPCAILPKVRRLSQYTQRRWLRLTVIAGLTVSSVITVWFACAQRASETDVISMLLSFAGLALSLADYLPPLPPTSDVTELADNLAATVREQWEEEVVARQLRDPQVIPLTWSSTRRPVAGSPESVVGPVDARVLRLSMRGRLSGDFDDAAAQLAAGLRRIPSGRLVVLGEPGSGKSVLAMMLTLGLLAERAERAVVPVLLSASTWDPINQSLNYWIVESLATAYYGGRSDVPQRLLRHGLILPILDGLDEIPESARRNAVRAINESGSRDHGAVVTCRSAEYEDVITGGSEPLRRAPVIEVAPVTVPEAVAYLRDVSWPEGVDWEPVYTRLAADPAGPLAIALSTPLALSLARTVYQFCDRDPCELLEFDGRHSVEDHLIDHLVTAAYAPPLDSNERHAVGSAWQREAKKAEEWLTFLATYLHRYQERNLAWWLMSGRLLSPWVGLVLGIGLGLALLVVFLLVNLITHHSDIGLMGGASAVYALVSMLSWYAAPGGLPGRLSLRLRGSLGRLRGGFAAGLKLIAVVAVPITVVVDSLSAFSSKWTVGRLVVDLQYAAGGVGLATALSVALSLRAWLDAPPERSVSASPLDLLRQDRLSSLVGALISGAILGIIWTPLICLGISVGFLIHGALANYHPLSLRAVLPLIGSQVYSDTTPTVIVYLIVLPAVGFALFVLLIRAWLRFVVLRIVLAIQRKLPWRLTRFLADARDRQLLRQSAGSYQFRHARLQERLASRSLAKDREPVPRERIVRRRRLRTVQALAVLAVCGIAFKMFIPNNTARITVITGDVAAMAFRPDRTALYTISNGGAVQEWDTTNGDKLGHWNIHIPRGQQVESIVVQPDGGLVIATETETSDRGGGYLLRWNEKQHDFSLSLDVWDDLVLSADGRYLSATGGEGGSIVLEWRTSNLGHAIIHATGDQPVGIETKDGRLAYLFHDKLKIGGQRGALMSNERLNFDDMVMDAAGDRFAGSHGGSVRILDRQGGQVKEIGIPHGNLAPLALSNDGSLLAATADGITRIWAIHE